jgi:predicted HTH transcriptional regulator
VNLQLKPDDLLNQVSCGEDSTRQFKADVRNAESLASEMAAFANTEGGTIYLGVADDGSTPGLDKADVARINQLISNAASQLVKSPLTVRTENVALKNGRIVIVLTVPKGLLPYHGLGSGIKRALSEWPEIDFADDRDGCLFTATVYRKPVEELVLADNGALKMQIKGQPDLINDLLNVLRANPLADYPSLAQSLGVSEATVKRHIQKLKQQNRLHRVGSRKTGYWEALE